MHYHFIAKNPPVPTPQASNTRTVPKFITGICQQPLEYLGMWKDLGINTLVDIPLNRTSAEKIAWVKEANRLNICQIREELTEISDDLQNPLLLAISTGDEPDLHRTPVSTLQALQSKYRGILPTFTNVDGAYLLGIQKNDDGFVPDYQGIVDCSDWLCSDIYPISGWNVRDGTPNGPVDLFSPGRASDKLIQMSKGQKPVLQYIECSVQQLSWLGKDQRSPTVVETSLILRQATARNLKGVVFYTIAQGAQWPKDFDLSTYEMKKLIAEFCAQQKV